MLPIRLVAALAWLLPALAAAQPSFDCGRAATRVEKAICADLELAAIDLRMAGVYQAARTLAGDHAKTELRDQQAAWLHQRDQDAGDVENLSAALRQSYRQRIELLEDHVLDTAVDVIPENPRQAFEALDAVRGAPARAWQAYLVATGDLGGRDFAAAARLFERAAPDAPDLYQLEELADRRFDAGDYRDVAVVLRHLRFAAARGPRIPCWIFSRHPEAAYPAFTAYYGSTLDLFPEICDSRKILEIPELAALDEVFDAMNDDPYGRCGSGTIRHAAGRNRQLFLLKASLHPDLLELPEAAAATWEYLRSWAVEAPRRDELYRRMLDQRDRAIPAVARFYRQQGLHEPRAMRAAHAAVDGILSYEFPDCGEP